MCVGPFSLKWFLAVQYNGKSGRVTPYMAVSLQSNISGCAQDFALILSKSSCF